MSIALGNLTFNKLSFKYFFIGTFESAFES